MKKNFVLLVVLMFVTVCCGTGYGQPPAAGPGTTPGTTAQVIYQIPGMQRTCSAIALDIANANLQITTLTAQKAVAQAAYNAAKSDMAQAAVDAANNPLYASYYNMLGAYYASQAFWYAGQIGDIQYWIDKENAKLQTLSAEYTARGC